MKKKKYIYIIKKNFEAQKGINKQEVGRNNKIKF